MRNFCLPKSTFYLLLAAALFALSILTVQSQQKRITRAKAAALQNTTLLFPENHRKTTLQLRELTGKLLYETKVQETEKVLNPAAY